MNILVADDDTIFRRTMAAILAKWPEHQVTMAKDGQAAWEILNERGRSIDIAFLDVHMPEMGGLELLKRLHGSPFYRSVQVVICTAANDRGTITQALKLGTKHYLVKPCNEAAITQKLAQISGTIAAMDR